jgi:hypothetical protein
MTPRSKLKPKRTDLGYLIGWFKVACKGDHAEAKRLALAYRKEHAERKSQPA